MPKKAKIKSSKKPVAKSAKKSVKEKSNKKSSAKTGRKLLKKASQKSLAKSLAKTRSANSRLLRTDDSGLSGRVKKSIPFEFVLENLDDLNVHTKPMFGALGVYLQNKIVFILRERPTSPEDNGVWLATTPEHHHSLQRDFPNMRSIALFGPGVTGWQILPADADDFEESVLKACELIRLGDERIGKIPKVKLRKKK